MMNQEPEIQLRDVVITSELQHRAGRSPNALAETLALEAIASATPHGHQAILKALCRLALALCDAGSAGINLLEHAGTDEAQFRWIAIEGRLAPYQNSVAGLDHSPCGYVYAQRKPQLLCNSERYYGTVGALGVPIVETLIAPLYRDADEIIGTMWVVAHEKSRAFDSEDLRILKLLGSHAAAAMRLHESLYQAP